MGCLTPTFSFDVFMVYYFTSFHLLVRLGVNKTLATGVTQTHNHWEQTASKKQSSDFEQCTSNKKAVYFWLEQ